MVNTHVHTLPAEFLAREINIAGSALTSAEKRKLEGYSGRVNIDGEERVRTATILHTISELRFQVIAITEGNPYGFTICPIPETTELIAITCGLSGFSVIDRASAKAVGLGPISLVSYNKGATHYSEKALIFLKRTTPQVRPAAQRPMARQIAGPSRHVVTQITSHGSS